jgi:hypothetical protein
MFQAVAVLSKPRIYDLPRRGCAIIAVITCLAFWQFLALKMMGRALK